jgi:hypothetical protein
LGAQARFDFARDNFLGIKTLQLIGQLKRQLLEVFCCSLFLFSVERLLYCALRLRRDTERVTIPSAR